MCVCVCVCVYTLHLFFAFVYCTPFSDGCMCAYDTCIGNIFFIIMQLIFHHLMWNGTFHEV